MSAPGPPGDAVSAPGPPGGVVERLGRLRGLLADVRIDGLVVTTRANVRYLTGFSGSAGSLVVTADAALLVTDGRYRTQAAEQLSSAGVGDLVDLGIGGLVAQADAVGGLLGRSLAPTVGLEADDVTWSAQRRWAAVLPGEVVPTSGLVERLRVVKDEGEITAMAAAADIADRALGEVLPMLGEGRTESEVALAIDTAMRRLGAEDRAFETIVASGPNAAKPHARPGPRVICAGDPVVVDFGATVGGYRSDMTRTFCVGGPPGGDLARVFEVVADAQAAGVAAVRASVAAGDVDAACRDRIAAAGWADAFEHGTGHGVGLDIHEAPSVAPRSTAILTPGTVVTVEPGVYLAGVGGVRIEDTVVVTDGGCRPLTRFPKDIAVSWL